MLIDVGYPYRLRGPSLSQSDDGLMWTSPKQRINQVGRDAANPSSSSLIMMQGVGVSYYSLHNRSAAAGVHGLGVRIPNRYWIAGQYVDATTTFTDDTVDAQDAGTGDFALETLTVNDGYIVASRCPFNAISIDIGTASVGTPVRVLHYSNVAGTGWTALTNYFILTGSGGNYAVTGTTIANEALCVFAAPSDWGLSSSLATGLPNGYYALRVQSTTAPTTAGVADNMSLYHLAFLLEGVADNGTLSQDFGKNRYIPIGTRTASGEWVGEALVALFETANPQNRATVDVIATL